MNIRMFCLQLEQFHASHNRCGQATADRCVHARPTTADHLCCPRAMMTCHARRWPTVCVGPRAMMACSARRRPTVCAIQGLRWHATPDDGRPSVLSNGDDGMPRPTPSYRLCCARAKMACHARRRLTVSASPKAMTACDARCRPTVSASPKAMMACHARCRPTVCAVQGL